jgi:hypothetical protein
MLVGVWFILRCPQCLDRKASDGMTNNEQYIGNYLEGICLDLAQVLSWLLRGGTAKSHEKRHSEYSGS